VAALAWLDAERPNLLALVQQAAAQGPREQAWLLADAMRGYLYLRRFSVDWLTIASAGWAAAHDAGEPRAEASAELSLADVHRSQGRYGEAIAHYERALALNRASGWLEAQSAVLSNLGNAHSDVGRPGLGAEHYQEALDIDRRTGRSAAEAVNLGNLGFVYQELGRFEEAADLHRRALDIDRRTGSRGSEAIDLANLGETCHALGRTSEAREHLTRALAMHREVGDRGGEAEALHAMAALYRDAGDVDRALPVAGEAVRLAAEMALAGCRARAGRDESAATLRREARAAFEDVGCPVPLGS
jgi:tetratricopeptide (TPR) repeat protein